MKNKSANNFRDKVFSVVRKSAVGKTLSYGEVAGRAGRSARAARAVGAILRTNFDPKIPCHRVIKSDGGLGGYNRGIVKKALILERELAMSKKHHKSTPKGTSHFVNKM